MLFSGMWLLWAQVRFSLCTCGARLWEEIRIWRMKTSLLDTWIFLRWGRWLLSEPGENCELIDSSWKWLVANITAHHIPRIMQRTACYPGIEKYLTFILWIFRNWVWGSSWYCWKQCVERRPKYTDEVQISCCFLLSCWNDEHSPRTLGTILPV